MAKTGRVKLTHSMKHYQIKVNDSAEIALQQIEEKGYARRFADNQRKVFKIGVSFSSQKRCIDDWAIE